MKFLSIATVAATVYVAASLTVEAKDIIVTTTNNDSPPAGQTSLKQAISQLADGDTIKFNIPGTGPHIIVTPMGGYPLITASDVTMDGYTQTDSKPNSNGILGGNNAVIQIVLDSTSDEAQPSLDPEKPDLLVRRSTRLPYSGYGDSENAIIGVLGGDNFKIRGISFIGRHTAGDDPDPSLYAIALINEAKNAKVQGCWFGLTPGDPYLQENIKPVIDAVAAFRWRDGGDVYSEGLVIGTDGDKVNDVQEFNVILGCHIALALEAPNVRVSGNYVNVFPDGLTFVDVEAVSGSLEAVGRTGSDASVEFFENGRVTDNTVIGTNGDGNSDGNERNIVAHCVYDHDIEFYSAANNAVVAGNYFGVGVDGTTAQKALTLRAPNFISLPGTAQVRIGSNGDGKSDDIEGNIIAGVPGTLFVDAGAAVPITARRNKMSGNFFTAFPFFSGENGRNYEDYYAAAILDPWTSGVVPIVDAVTDGIMTGSLPTPNTTAAYTRHVVDIYVIDPLAEAMALTHPGTYVGSFVDNGTNDKDPAADKFNVDLRAMPIKPGVYIALAVTYTGDAAGTSGTNSITAPLSSAALANMPILIPGSIESVGLSRIVPDKPLIVPQNDKLGNWEPNASVLGTSTFLIEGNTFAEGWDMPSPDGKQRYVVALQPVDGSAGKLAEGFYSDDFKPYKDAINASRQNGNPGRVAGDKRPGAKNYIVGGEASPHAFPAAFGSDSRWTLGFDRLGDGRYGTVQTFELDTATLVPTPLMKAVDSANGRLTSGVAAGSEITRFGGDMVCLDNGNFVSVVEDRTKNGVRSAKNCITATIFAPDGTVVKDSWMIVSSEAADRDIWSNVAAYKGGFAVRCQPQDGSATRHIYLFDNAGNLVNTIPQTSSGLNFDTGRGDGTRIAGHINSPYLFLAGKMTDATVVKMAVWDTRDPQRVATFEVSEPAFIGNSDRVNLAVDALNRVVVAWDSQPDGYEAVQVAARVLALNEETMTVSSLTPSFFPFINVATTGGIRSTRMTIAMTTKQICVAAKGEINLDNKPAEGAFINPDSGVPLSEINFYTVFTHPAPADDPTPPVSSEAPTLTIGQGAAAGTLTIGWAPATAGFSLYSTPSLSAPTWTLVGTQNPTTVTIGAGNQFFQLRK